MSNIILEGLNAIKEIITNMTSVSTEVIEQTNRLKAELKTMTKDQLIDMLVAEKIKGSTKEPTQRDLVCAILKDERCRALDYTEISDCILENMHTKLKYSPSNIAWYKSQLTIDGEELVARMSTVDRRKLDRQIAMATMKNLQ